MLLVRSALAPEFHLAKLPPIQLAARQEELKRKENEDARL
jgi:hypothetical protein